jgi:ribosomal protein S6--L-glutamate ligase
LLAAGRQRGHKMHLVDHAKCNLAVRAKQAGVYYRDRLLPRPDGVIPRIGASITVHGAAVIAQYESMRVPTTTTSSALLRARDKLRCLQHLAGFGIPVPDTILCTQRNSVRSAMRALGGPPLVLKLLESTHGVGVDLAESSWQVMRTAEAYLQLHRRFLMQEFIAEAEGCDLRALVVGGQVVAAMRRRAAPGEFRSNLHRGATSEAIELSEEEVRLVLRVAELMELDVAGVDLIPSDRGPLVMEVNASPGLEGIENATGIDIAGAIIEFIVQKADHGPAAS